MTGAHAPSGRAARLRLRRSLRVAERGADLLERELHVMNSELHRLRQDEERTRRAWHELLQEAETWLLRGLLLSGERGLDPAVGTRPAEVAVAWTVSLGVRRPAGVHCVLPERDATTYVPANTAVVHAEDAYREAVRAAAEYAAARSAARVVAEQVESTRRRVRALRRHWVPRLLDDLAHVELALEQAEFEDGVRRRWAARTVGEGPPPGGRATP